MTRLTSRIRLPGRRLSWPLMLLLASGGITSIAAISAQRTERSHRRTAERLLRDYAAFTAWTSQRQVIGTLEGAVMASLQYIMHRRELHENTRNGPVPSAYFGFTLGGDTLRVAPRAATPEADAWLEVAPQRDRHWLVDSLTTHVRRVHDFDQNCEVLVSPRFGTGRMIAYALMPTVYGDTVVYGVEFSAKTSRHIFRNAFEYAALLPKELMLGKKNEDLLGVRIVGPASLPLYESPRWPETRYAVAQEARARPRRPETLHHDLESRLSLQSLNADRGPHESSSS